MLFYLTDSLIVDNHDQRFKDICTAIYHLAVQSAEGNHVVIGDIDVISHYRNIFKNDYCVGPLFNKLYQNITFEVVPSFINYYVEVVLTNPSNRVDQDGRTVVQLEYSSLTPLEASNKTSLVCEFLSDAKFYDYILSWFINKLGVNVHYAFHKVDGGGTNTHLNIINELDSNHITLSILDTDCRYPNAPIDPNGTYGKCIGIGVGNVLCEIMPLYVHEVENLIPMNFIDQVFTQWTNGDAEYARKKKAFDYLKKEAESILPYFDYKKGIRYNEDFRNIQELQTFAQKCYEQNDEKMAVQPNFSQFVSTLNDKEYIYTELIGGTGTIKMTISLIDSGNAPNPILYQFQEENWKKIGQEMINWCIAREPEAIH